MKTLLIIALLWLVLVGIAIACELVIIVDPNTGQSKTCQYCCNGGVCQLLCL